MLTLCEQRVDSPRDLLPSARPALPFRWEIDPELCALAEDNIASRLRSQAGRARVVCGDARQADVTGADVVLLYMLPEANAVLAKQVLEPQLPAGCGARVVRRRCDQHRLHPCVIWQATAAGSKLCSHGSTLPGGAHMQVAHTFSVPGWTPASVKTVDSVTLYLYRR